jgi:hypothetical protein
MTLGYAVGGRYLRARRGRLSEQPSVNVDGVTPASGWVLVAGAAGIGLDNEAGGDASQSRRIEKNRRGRSGPSTAGANRRGQKARCAPE